MLIEESRGCLKSELHLTGLKVGGFFGSPKHVGCTTGPGLQEPRLAGGAGSFFVDGFLFTPKQKLCFFLLTRGKHVENRKHEFESRIMRCLSFGD